MSAPLKVTVTDAESGEQLGEQLVPPGDYVLICHEPCHLANTQAYPLKGTHVLTVKGHAPQGGGRSPATRRSRWASTCCGARPAGAPPTTPATGTGNYSSPLGT